MWMVISMTMELGMTLIIIGIIMEAGLIANAIMAWHYRPKHWFPPNLIGSFSNGMIEGFKT